MLHRLPFCTTTDLLILKNSCNFFLNRLQTFVSSLDSLPHNLTTPSVANSILKRSKDKVLVHKVFNCHLPSSATSRIFKLHVPFMIAFNRNQPFSDTVSRLVRLRTFLLRVQRHLVCTSNTRQSSYTASTLRRSGLLIINVTVIGLSLNPLGRNAEASLAGPCKNTVLCCPEASTEHTPIG